MQFIPKNHYIKKLESNEVFVFGSNVAGKHGAGGARMAMQLFGARYSEGIGRTGQCYAIPTKDRAIEPLTVKQIKPYVVEFLQYAKEHPELRFLLTDVGCGLAGNDPSDIAPLFKKHSPNVILPEAFYELLYDDRTI
jgi:hypothetical protein